MKDEGNVMTLDNKLGQGRDLATYSSNSTTVLVVAASTNGQLPASHETSVPVELLFWAQYDAAEYCSNRLNLASRSALTAG